MHNKRHSIKSAFWHIFYLLFSKSLKYIKTITSTENLDDYFSADGYKAGYYKVNGMNIAGTTIYGALLLLGNESRSMTVQVIYCSTHTLVRNYSGNPNAWTSWMKYEGTFQV